MLYTGWSQVWIGQVECLGVDGIIVLSCYAIGFGVIKYTIEHEVTGMGWFSREPIWN